MPRFVLILGLISLVGCASNSHLALQSLPPVKSEEVQLFKELQSLARDTQGALAVSSRKNRLSSAALAVPKTTIPEAWMSNDLVQVVAHDETVQPVVSTRQETAGTLTIDGRQYQLKLIENQSDDASVVTADHSLESIQDTNAPPAPIHEVTPIALPMYSNTVSNTSQSSSAPLDSAPMSNVQDLTAPYIDNPNSESQFSETQFSKSQFSKTHFSPVPYSDSPVNTIHLNLPSALAMVGGKHPAIGLAQWRVREAYAQLERAEVLWLPSIQAGLGFHRHDGNYQASDGSIVDVNRNSFQYGFGTGATGAGTTSRPGLVAQFHLADAIFQPEIAKKTAWARGHAAKAVLNQQMLRTALAYIELLDAHQEMRIIEESRGRTAELSKITVDFAEAGEGLKADADRMRTELTLIDSRLIAARERIAIASARLSQTISAEASTQIIPMDVVAVPLELVTAPFDKSSLISTGLSQRPELKESQALVAAACDAFKREKYAPLVPSVLLGYSTGGFGGGLGNSIDNVSGRYDLDAVMSWEVRNLGFGEQAARRESSARIQQAKFEKLQVMDQIALEISESFSQVQFRRQQMATTQLAIQTAQQSYQSNSDRIRDGEGLPIEVLQAVQALETARRSYLRSVVAFNQAQFRLQWALGWPVNASATTMPTS